MTYACFSGLANAALPRRQPVECFGLDLDGYQYQPE